DYDEFYTSTFHDWEKPARTISFHAEGALSYDALLFIPSRAPFDLYSKDYEKGLALYSSNVMIQEKCAELVPDYFNFVRGIVDSADITLNISRETLQHDRQLRAIASRVEKKIAADLADMRDNDRASFETFFENFGRGLKYGIYASYGMKKDDLADLLLFYSAKQEKLVTLKEYREAAPEDQKAIYYAAGESTERLAHMPMVTSVLARGYDVLLCTQDVDDFCFQAMQSYDEQQLKNVAGGNLDLETEDDKKAAEEAANENEALLGAMKDALGDKVVRVSVSPVLTDAPSALSSEGPISLEMEKVMAGQAGAEDVKSQRVLELNAKHPVFETLRAAEEAGDTEKIASYTDLLYNQALLVAGLPVEDPVAFAQAVCELMK
ncbi:MAG: molecular chaperone HtpG, partial [Coriobacteriaceae bacterium]|nr:molecular chaperone HtpG [Coriobacteriaceae bacterium]